MRDILQNSHTRVIVPLFAALILSFSAQQHALAQTITEIIDFSGDGTNDLVWPAGVAVDGSSNVYLAGRNSDNAFKITPGGGISQIIDATGDGLGKALSRPLAIAVDGSGNVYVTGRDTDNAFKITSLGVVTQIIDTTGDGTGSIANRTGNFLEWPAGIAVDGSGNVYVTGTFSDNAFKITSGGGITQIIDTTGDGTGSIANGTGNFLDRPVAIAVDASENVYVAGTVSNNVFKITPGGTITAIIDTTGDGTGSPTLGTGNFLDFPQGIAVDGSGNVYVAGANSDNVFKITPLGDISQIIDATGDGTGNGLNEPIGVAVDGSENVYVAGASSNNAFMITPGGIITQMIDFNGDGGFFSQLGRPEAIAVEASGTVYVPGATSDNAFKIEFPSLGVELTDFNGTVDGDKVLLSWQTTSESNNAGFEVQHSDLDDDSWKAVAFVAGYGTTTEAQLYRHDVSGMARGRHLFRLKQIDVDGSFAYSHEVEVLVGVPNTHLLSEAYPNPFNPKARFTLATEEAQNVLIEVHNALGQRVAVLHDGVLTGGTTHSFTLDGSSWPSGTYLYRVRGETFTESRIVFLLK